VYYTTHALLMQNRTNLKNTCFTYAK